MLLLIQYTLVFASVLTLVALGGCYSEHSGVINIGLEGIMVIGGLGGALVLKYIPPEMLDNLITLFTSHLSPEMLVKYESIIANAVAPGIYAFIVVAAAILTSIVCGMLYSLLLAVASVNFNADQTLVGTAMNMLGLAFAVVIVKAINISETGGADNSAIVSFVANKKALLIAEGTEFYWFMPLTVILLIIAFIVLYKTRFGLRLMACGEHPQAANSVGINVQRMRYSGVLISGALGGLGGLVYITAGVSRCDFVGGVAGFGFLALAVMIFGQWKPLRIALAALLFGFFRALANVYTIFDFLVALQIPKPIYNMLPYIISLIVLAFTSKKSRAPKAEGIPFDKSTR